VILRAGPRTVGREILPVATLGETLRARDPALAEAAETRLGHLGRARLPIAGLPMDRPQVMGVLNVTPDSFSDGGDRRDPGRAIEDGLEMLAAGAALLDVGGESTRPGAAPVDLDEELRRVVPVVRGLAGQGALVSIDTRRARVMAEALDAGAAVINDVTALAGDPETWPRVSRPARRPGSSAPGSSWTRASASARPCATTWKSSSSWRSTTASAARCCWG
jgi:dihydropteroate synthase